MHVTLSLSLEYYLILMRDVWFYLKCIIYTVILGLLKFCTFGFMLIWTLVDILLIALQVYYILFFLFSHNTFSFVLYFV